MRLPTAIYFARQSTLGFCNWLVVTCLFSMSFILNAIQKTLGSAVSFVVDYGKWIIGCNQNAVALENSLVPCASPLVSTRRGYECYVVPEISVSSKGHSMHLGPKISGVELPFLSA